MKIRSRKTSKTEDTKTQRSNRQDNKTAVQTEEIVFKSQVKAINNYFTLLHSIFGKDTQIKTILKNIPHQKHLTQQYHDQSHKANSHSHNHTDEEEQRIKQSEHCTNRTYLQTLKDSSNSHPAHKAIILRRNKKNSIRGYLVKGSAASKHLHLMQKIQSSHNIMDKQSSPLRYEQEYCENFKPIGKTVQKMSLSGVTLQDDSRVIKFNRPKNLDIIYRTHQKENKRTTHKFTTQVSERTTKAGYPFDKQITKQKFQVKKMSAPHAQSCRERQFSPWDLSTTVY